jgi:hypothetical protein
MLVGSAQSGKKWDSAHSSPNFGILLKKLLEKWSLITHLPLPMGSQRSRTGCYTKMYLFICKFSAIQRPTTYDWLGCQSVATGRWWNL